MSRVRLFFVTGAGFLPILLVLTAPIVFARQSGNGPPQLDRRGRFMQTGDSGPRPSVPVHVPLWFEPNRGQAPPGVLFFARSGRFRVYLMERQMVLVPTYVRVLMPSAARVPDHEPVLSTVTLTFTGSDPPISVTGVDPRPGRVHYFRGANPRDWRVDIPTYGGVVYRGLYPGIDLRVYATAGGLEFDLEVAPGVDPETLTLRVTGAQSVRVDADGRLGLQTDHGTFYLQRPRVYQTIAGRTRFIDASYKVEAPNRVRFVLGEYDRRRYLVIDPVLTYATYLGGDRHDTAMDVAVDGNGFMVVVGWTQSPDFPIHKGLKNGSTYGGVADAFVTKFTPDGAELVFSTYLGGRNWDQAVDVELDGRGNIYVGGATLSDDFPIHRPIQRRRAGGFDIFLTQLAPSGSRLRFSTYIGGSGHDFLNDMDVGALRRKHEEDEPHHHNHHHRSRHRHSRGIKDWLRWMKRWLHGDDGPEKSGKRRLQARERLWKSWLHDHFRPRETTLYLTGTSLSADFPVTPKVFQGTLKGTQDCVVMAISEKHRALRFSTYLGGSKADACYTLEVDKKGRVWLTGETTSDDFPVSPGALLSTMQGGFTDAFVARLDARGRKLLAATYLGGEGIEPAMAIRERHNGDVLVAGVTDSRVFAGRTLPHRGQRDVYLVELDKKLSQLRWITTLGGVRDEFDVGLELLGPDRIFLFGHTESPHFPCPDPLQPPIGGALPGPGNNEFFLTRMVLKSPPQIEFSSCLGGSRSEVGNNMVLDAFANIYLVGQTASSDFPTTPNAFDQTCGNLVGCSRSLQDAVLLRISQEPLQEVPVDVKPRACPNEIRLGDKKGKGKKKEKKIEVAVVGDVLDVTQIVPTSIRLMGVTPLRWRYRDVATPFYPYTGKKLATDCHDLGPDHTVDLVLTFRGESLLEVLGKTRDGEVRVLRLTGNMKDGTPIWGEDVVVFRR